MKVINNSKHKFFILTLIGICISFSSCKNTETDIGSSFFESHANFVTIDTLTVKMETVYLDSIATSGTGMMLVGTYRDALCGNSTATSYMKLGAPDDRSIYQTAVYDSLCFLIEPDDYFLGDTLQPFTLSVHQLLKTITLPENQAAFYNTSEFPYDPIPLGSWSGKIYPFHTDTISIRLSDQLGQNLFDAIVYTPDKLSSDQLFVQNYLKGVVLTGKNNNTIFGFAAGGDSSGYMRLYYHETGDAKNILHTDFRIFDANLQFNHIENDRNGTPFKNLSSKNKIADARSTNYLSVTQPLNNLAIRMSFPYLQNLLHLGRYVQIMGARIVLYPPPGSYSAARPLPTSLRLFRATGYHTVVDSISGANENFVADNLYKNAYYTYDITGYITNEIRTSNKNYQTKLLLVPAKPAYNTSFSRLILSDQLSDKDGVQLSVQLVMYNAE